MTTTVRREHPCPYCWVVLYSKSAYTRHTNAEHWEEIQTEDKMYSELKKEKTVKETTKE